LGTDSHILTDPKQAVQSKGLKQHAWDALACFDRIFNGYQVYLAGKCSS